MPSWGIHLATANELIKKINVNDKNAFLIGNFIPDAEKHVIADFSIFVPYNISHFAEFQNVDGNIERLPNPNEFINKYGKKLNNPLVLGYLTHLLTDYYWNKITALRYTIRDEEGTCIAMKLNDGTEVKADKNIRRTLKHNDFYLFEEQLIQNYEYELPVYNSNLMDYIKEIEETKYKEEDFIKIVDYVCDKFNEIKIKNSGTYKLYTKEQMEIDFNNSIEFIISILNIKK